MIALITNRNNPSVSTVRGMVRMMKMGFTMALAIASTSATRRAYP